MSDQIPVKPWRFWRDIPGYKYKGRYFEAAVDYKASMIRREEDRHIRSSHINRKLSKHEERSFIPFFNECLCYKKDNYCTSKSLYPHYLRFCKERYLIPLGASTFAACIKSYVFLQEKIPGVWYARKDPILNENLVGYYNLGLKNETNLNN